MLSTTELIATLDTIPYPHGVSREERPTAMRAYNEKRGALIAQWKEWLHDVYADGFSTQAADVIYAKAWEDGHSSGYREVEMWYQELSDLVTKIKELDFA